MSAIRILSCHFAWFKGEENDEWRTEWRLLSVGLSLKIFWLIWQLNRSFCQRPLNFSFFLAIKVCLTIFRLFQMHESCSTKFWSEKSKKNLEWFLLISVQSQMEAAALSMLDRHSFLHFMEGKSITKWKFVCTSRELKGCLNVKPDTFISFFFVVILFLSSFFEYEKEKECFKNTSLYGSL